MGGVGVSLAYLTGRDTKSDNEVISHQYEAGLYWRGQWGGLTTFARGTAAHVKFDSTRRFSGLADGVAVSAKPKASGREASSRPRPGASYDDRMGRFSVRPSAMIEYYKLTEKAYDESGGGDALRPPRRQAQQQRGRGQRPGRAGL